MRHRLRILLMALALLHSPAVLGAAGPAPPALPVHDDVGGPFEAESSLGRKVHSSEFEGKVVLLFFGYTSCQDICPAAMAHLAALTRALGPESEGVQVLLSTIDPENDTAEHLEAYLERFDPRFVGLTGTSTEMNRIAAMFMVKHDASHGMRVTTEHNRSKAFVDEAYLYAHSQQIYVIDKRGRARGFFYVGSSIDEMAAAVKALLAE